MYCGSIKTAVTRTRRREAQKELHFDIFTGKYSSFRSIILRLTDQEAF